jgi:hypothetical protein
MRVIKNIKNGVAHLIRRVVGYYDIKNTLLSMITNLESVAVLTQPSPIKMIKTFKEYDQFVMDCDKDPEKIGIKPNQLLSLFHTFRGYLAGCLHTYEGKYR